MRTIADRYRLTEKIGSGGMGEVWRARDEQLGRDVAVKILHPALASDTAFGERFRREARNAAQLSHPNVVGVFDTGSDDGVPYIVMEFVDGRPLDRLLRDDGPLSVSEAIRIGRAVLAALSHAHQRGLVHRDVKPANILLTPSGEVKVADFGIAKGLDDTAGLTRSGALMGTAAYLSPEQAAGEPSDDRSDLYAVGCLLYTALTGSPPFTAESPVAVALLHVNRDPTPVRQRRADIPPALDALIMRALRKPPTERFPSAAAMGGALAAVPLGADHAQAPADTTVELQAPAPTQVLPVARRREARSKLPSIIAVAVVVVAVAWLVAAFLSAGSPPLEAPQPMPSFPAPTETAPTPADDGSSEPILDLPGIEIG